MPTFANFMDQEVIDIPKKMSQNLPTHTVVFLETPQPWPL